MSIGTQPSGIGRGKHFRTTILLCGVLALACVRDADEPVCTSVTDVRAIPDAAQVDLLVAVHRRSMDVTSFQREFSSALAGTGAELLTRGRSVRVGVMDVAVTSKESSFGVLEPTRDNEPWAESGGPTNPVSRLSFLGFRDGGAETATHLMAFPGNETARGFFRDMSAASILIAPREVDETAVDTGLLVQHLAASFPQPVRLIMLADAAGACSPDSEVSEALSRAAVESGGDVIDACLQVDAGFDSSHLLIAEYLERRPRVFPLSRPMHPGSAPPEVVVRTRDGGSWIPTALSYDESDNAVQLAPAPDGGATVSISYCAETP